jgi:serine protease Do
MTNPASRLAVSRFSRPNAVLLLALVLGSLGLGAVSLRGSGTALADKPAAGTQAGPADRASVDAARASARSLGLAFSDVAKRASPSVVSIRIESKAPQQNLPPGFEQFFGGQPQPGIQRGGGSGIIVRGDGHILTNNHVVENASRIDVRLHDGRTFSAKVIGTDPASDLAVIKIDAKGLAAAKFADSDEALIGEWVVAIGSPFGLDYSVTTGVLSAKGRGAMGASQVGDYLQTDASINPGNSGGPLVNLDAEVLGVNTFIIGRGTGIGFSIPAVIASNVADQIIDRGTVRRAWIGVSFQEITPELAGYFGRDGGKGALVASVIEGGPAHRAGVMPGDIITAVASKPLDDAQDLQREVLRLPVGSTVKLAILREGKAKTLDLITAERPGDFKGAPRGPKPRGEQAPSVPGALGLHVEPITPAVRARLGYQGKGSVIVSHVEPGSPADRAGLARGDILLAVNHRTAATTEDVLKALAKGKALLRVERGGGEQFVVVTKD